MGAIRPEAPSLLDHDFEPDAVDALGVPNPFVDDVARVALGAFRRIDLVFR